MDQATQFKQTVDSEGRQVQGFRGVPLDGGPRSTAHKRSAHPGLASREDIVVAPIPDIKDLVGIQGHDLGEPLKELGIGFAGSPVVRRADQIDVLGEERLQDQPCLYRLVARDPKSQPVGPESAQGRAHIVAEILFPKHLWLPGSRPLLSLLE